MLVPKFYVTRLFKLQKALVLKCELSALTSKILAIICLKILRSEHKGFTV